jgi:hypothetical protein
MAYQVGIFDEILVGRIASSPATGNTTNGIQFFASQCRFNTKL